MSPSFLSGRTDAVEQEGHDRKTLGLTGNQEELVQAVFAANPRTVVVEMSAGPLTVPWVKKNIPAMLQAWWPGEEGGQAIAEVLFGEVNPAGRLPHTVYASETQVPPLDEYDVTKGFTYMYFNGEPLFPFGHGLSYSSYRYSNLKVKPEKVAAGGEITVTVEVRNEGTREGDEVPQLDGARTQAGGWNVRGEGAAGFPAGDLESRGDADGELHPAGGEAGILG